MKPNPTFVVLTDLADAHNQLTRYAAGLAQALDGRLVLLHAYHELVMDPEFGYAAGPFALDSQEEIRRALLAVAATLPVPTEVEVTIEPLRDAVEDAVRRYEPLLIVMGLSETGDWFDRLLSNAALPILRSTHYPLLLVPEATHARPVVPRHALIATDGEPFALAQAARTARELFDALQMRSTVLVVRPEEQERAPQPAPGAADVLPAIRQGLHLPDLPETAFHPLFQDDPADGILRATTDLAPDLLVFIARRRSFFGELFHRSVTARVAQRTPVPILLLPEQPGNE